MSQFGKRMIAALVLALTVAVAAAPRTARAYEDDRYNYTPPRYQDTRGRGYNDEYIFATTRMVSEWEVHPAVKVPLFPPAVVIDIVFLPAEVIAGLF